MNDEKSRGRNEQRSADSVARKPYVSPALQVHGDVAELTRTHSRIGNMDGGSGAKRKTG